MQRPQSRRLGAGNPIKDIVRGCGSIFLSVALFSGVMNFLALTGSIYMLQVYDRVIPSKSIPTLIGLTIIMMGFYICNGLLDFFRARAMARVGIRIDQQLRGAIFDLVRAQRRQAGSDGLQPVRDLDQIRTFMSGMGPTALFDIPWIPVFLIFVTLLHPWLGMMALCGALLVVALTVVTDLKARGPMRDAAAIGSARMALADSARRNSESIHVLGMGQRLSDRWYAMCARSLSNGVKASDVTSGMGAVSRTLRMLLQSCVLGLGAYLAVIDQISAGSIIAASILTARALAPVEIAITHWNSFLAARQGYQRLSDQLEKAAATVKPVVMLPPPERSLAVEKLTITLPGDSQPILQNVSFSLQSGQGLGIIGPTGSGKSTLAKAMVGAWISSHSESTVRFDGATLDQWSPDALGRHIGYLPQEIELLEGTIADNICRFDPEASSENIIAAAQLSGVHDLIVALPKGYATEVGPDGQRLSGGQRQRVALARALYGNPFLVVLDEPNSNLDSFGDQALTSAIKSVRARGGIVVIVAHRPSAIASVELLLALHNGKTQAFGPKDEVLAKVMTASDRTPVPTNAPVAKAPTKSGGASPFRPVTVVSAARSAEKS